MFLISLCNFMYVFSLNSVENTSFKGNNDHKPGVVTQRLRYL